MAKVYGYVAGSVQLNDAFGDICYRLKNSNSDGYFEVYSNNL